MISCEGEDQEFLIVGSEEADIANGKISHQSPLGKCLLGKKKGDKAILELSDRKIEYKVKNIK